MKRDKIRVSPNYSFRLLNNLKEHRVSNYISLTIFDKCMLYVFLKIFIFIIKQIIL